MPSETVICEVCEVERAIRAEEVDDLTRDALALRSDDDEPIYLCLDVRLPVGCDAHARRLFATMTAPTLATPPTLAPLGLSRDEKHVYSWNDGTEVRWPIPSVTSVLRVVDKSGPLIGWAKRITAEAALNHAGELPLWVAEFGRDASVRMLTSRATQERDKAADIGTRAHTLAEAIARGQEVIVEDELRSYVTAYLRWREDWKPVFRAVEFMVANLRHDFAGTGDLFCDLDGVPTLIDIKSSRGVYEETALQLAAYGNAEFAGRPGDKKRYAPIRASQYAVLHLRPEGYELIPYCQTESEQRDAWMAFLDARRLWRWREKGAKSVMGKPMQKKEAVA